MSISQGTICVSKGLCGVLIPFSSSPILPTFLQRHCKLIGVIFGTFDRPTSPDLDLASISAPARRSVSTSLVWPFSAAQPNAVRPFFSSTSSSFVNHHFNDFLKAKKGCKDERRTVANTWPDIASLVVWVPSCQYDCPDNFNCFVCLL